MTYAYLLMPTMLPTPLWPIDALHGLCIILALVCFLVAVIPSPTVSSRAQLGWLGLFFVALAILVF